MKQKFSILLWAALGLGLTPLLGALRGFPAINDLATGADAVVVAQVSDIALSDVTPAGSVVSAVLKVDRVLKGSFSPLQLLPCSWAPKATLSPGQIRRWVGKSGLFFLRQASPAECEFMSQVSPSTEFEDIYIPIPAGPIHAAYSYLVTAPLLDKVLSELASAVEQSGGKDPALEFIHHGGLEPLKSDVPLKLYERLSEQVQPENRGLGVAGLIRRGYASGLVTLDQESEVLSKARTWPLVTFSVAGYYRNPDPAGLSILGRLATSAGTDSKLRAAAASALSAIHTREALPYLAVLLDSLDPELESDAAGGLAMFANKVGVLTPNGRTGYQPLSGDAPFRTKETLEHFAMGQVFQANRAQYISFWKTWWAQNRVALGY